MSMSRRSIAAIAAVPGVVLVLVLAAIGYHWWIGLVALVVIPAVTWLTTSRASNEPTMAAPHEPSSAFLRGTQKNNRHTGFVDTDADYVYDGDSEDTDFGANVRQRRRKA